MVRFKFEIGVPNKVKYPIGIIVFVILCLVVYWKFFKTRRRTFVVRPEKGKVKDILEKTNQISKDQREAFSKMTQPELEHELNKSYRELQKGRKTK